MESSKGFFRGSTEIEGRSFCLVVFGKLGEV